MISQALESFIASEEFAQTVLDATVAESNGGRYSVELFEGGSYRLLPNNSIGSTSNLYESPGVVLSIPILNNERWNDVAEAEERGDDPCKVVRDYYADELAEELRNTLAYEND